MWKNFIIALLSLSLLALWLSRPDPRPEQPVPVVPSQEPDTLTSLLQEMQAAPGLEAASIGFCLLEASLTPVIDYHADEAMTPASALKAVTSATALEQLGPEFQFHTQLASTKPFVVTPQGSFDGDLVLKGGGDPMLTTETFVQWARELRSSGLTMLTGGIIADAQHFPEQMIPNAWDWGDVSNYYGAGPSGLNLDFNRCLFSFTPGAAVGDPAAFAMQPPLPWLECQNFSKTVSGESPAWTSVYGGPYTKTFTLRGEIPLGDQVTQCQAAIPDPALYATWVFERALLLAGIQFQGTRSTVRDRRLANMPTIESPAILKSHASEPLTEIIRYLHRTSDNMVTECLFQSLIKHHADLQDGVTIVKQHWQNRGLSMQGLRMEDGSGLARADFIRPRDLASVLWLARRGPQGDAYANTLNLYHDGRVRWKGGAMSRVRAYTGFARGQDDRELTFALILNNYDTDSEAIAAWRNRIIEAMLTR